MANKDYLITIEIETRHSHYDDIERDTKLIRLDGIQEEYLYGYIDCLEEIYGIDKIQVVEVK